MMPTQFDLFTPTAYVALAVLLAALLATLIDLLNSMTRGNG